ncbi:MAG TPA: DUF2231 domain-containing protein [Pyrinomonadaceae bacterium]|jgi:uncharacterized membrane protein|nr:DUF2231 domain-containing protein [Pyrinomonadaceae bacterium]
MESKFRVLGHGAHPILIVFPLGLLGGSVIFDIMYLVSGTDMFSFVAYWLIAVGIVSGVVAAVPGFVDWFAIPKGTRAKSVGLIHGIGNDVVLVLFALSWWLRYDNRPFHVPSTAALVLSFAGLALAMVTGWLGGELVERLGMSVHEGAHLDAPNSLSGRPASERD